MRFWTRLAVPAAMTLVGLLMAAPAQAQSFGIDNFTAQVFANDTRDANGAWVVNDTDAYTNTGGDPTDAYPVPGTGTGVYELAGGHPFIGVTDFSFVRAGGDSGPPADGNVAALRVDIPRGLVPNPGGFEQCTDEQLEAFSCPPESQIGAEELTLYIEALAGLGDIQLQVPLYNMTPLSDPHDPQRDVVARFAFHPAEAAEAIDPVPALPGLPPELVAQLNAALPALANGLLALHPVHIVGGVRDQPSPFGPHDNGLYFTIDNLPAYDEASPSSPGVIRSNLMFWGAPGDAAHDGERGVSCVELGALPLPPFCTPVPDITGPDPDIPFLTNPTECSGAPLASRLTVYSHADQSDTTTDRTPTIVDSETGEPKEGAQHCENLPFEPGLTLAPAAAGPDSPFGPIVGTPVPQPGLHDRNLFATAHIDDLTVTLPAGMTLNPSTANGLQACTDAQFGANLGAEGGEACPAASRIGAVRVVSPLLPPTAGAPDATPELTGSAYVGQPLPGRMYRLFVTVEGRDVSIRLKGAVDPHPVTGQITATFPDNPQLPFADLEVDFRDGPRAPLATPLDCGPKAASARFTPWSGQSPATASAPFATVGAGCPAGFAPGFAASSANPLSGAFAPFAVAVDRPDGQQFLSDLRVDAPPGLGAVIRGVPQCADELARTGACPAESRIGTATTTAGAGPEPYRLSGPVYLTEGYKGAPFGTVAAIRAIAGPYDLGAVVVRQEVYVGDEDAHVSVISDPLPRILEGVPIRLRNLHVDLDRPRFVYNPTSCGAKRVDGTLQSTAGRWLARTAGVRFEGCERLDFRPRMALRLRGRRQARFRGHPALHARIRQPAGQANFARVRVKLPASLALDPRNSQIVCGVEAARRADCPRSTRIGFVRAISPALNERLRGPLYLVQGIRVDPETGNEIRTLPSLLAKLSGEVRVNLRGTTEVVGRRSNLVSTFRALPDAPVSRVDLRVRGGKRGILAVTARRGLCGQRQLSRRWMVGQNGKVARSRARVATPCKRRPSRRRARG